MTLIEPYCPGCASAAVEVCNLKKQVERLEAIVDKLYKTADGVVVVPGMTLYDAEGEPVIVGGKWFNATVSNGDGDLDHVRVAGYYSTREAAKAAITRE